MTTRTFLTVLVGALFADLLALSAAMRSGRIKAARWKRPIAYLGMVLQGTLACICGAILLPPDVTSISAFSLGLNLPFLIEKFAGLTPSLNVPALPREVGFQDSKPIFLGSSLESIRRILAKEE